MIDFQWLIGGEAGYGIMTTGNMMSKIFTRLGLSVFDYVEYPSLIRGGHNAYYVRASDQEISSQKRKVDVLVALNKLSITKHKDELTENSAVIYDPAEVKLDASEFGAGILLVPVPLVEIAKKEGASKFMINTVAVGASLGILYDDYAVLGDMLNEIFGRKGEKVVAENVNLSKNGFDHARQVADKFPIHLEKKEHKNLLIGGAEAVTYGAIRAGVKFGAMYPMTPTNGILAILAENALKYNIIVKEPEDEIAGINMAIGASFAGVRSLASTAGGGFALMTEGFGLAAQAEVPLVVVVGMRPGPATGMPTWTDQGDLRMVLHAAQGDFPRIVLAPGDHIEAFSDMMLAFNLAEKYQLQVIVLVDKYLMEGHASYPQETFKKLAEEYKIERGKLLRDEDLVNENDYKRYLLTEDGISPRSIPGQKGGISLTGSDEHDERGLYNEESEVRIKMMHKRFRKLDMAHDDILPPKYYGWEDAPITILSFGSTKFPIFDAIRMLKNEGIKLNFLQLTCLNPFPSDIVSAVINNARKTLVIEANYTGQVEGLIREHTGMKIDHNFRKYDGRPFYPEEIVEYVKGLLGSQTAKANGARVGGTV